MKYYLEDSILLYFQWELTQAQEEALNFFSPLLAAYLMELSAQRQENLFHPAMAQILSRNSLPCPDFKNLSLFLAFSSSV